MEHLAQCSACASRFHTLQRFEQQLEAQLARWDCPSPQAIADYHWGLADRSTSQIITDHLESCVRCTEELETLRVFLDADVVQTPPSTSPVIVRPAGSRLRELIAVLLPSSPMLAVRGDGRAPLVAEADDMTIVLDVQPTEVGKVALLGQVATADPDRWMGALVEIRQAGSVRAVAEVDDVASFQCEVASAGRSELRITAPDGASIVLPELELRHA
jgi:hypothetical protein